MQYELEVHWEDDPTWSSAEHLVLSEAARLAHVAVTNAIGVRNDVPLPLDSRFEISESSKRSIFSALDSLYRAIQQAEISPRLQNPKPQEKRDGSGNVVSLAARSKA